MAMSLTQYLNSGIGGFASTVGTGAKYLGELITQKGIIPAAKTTIQALGSTIASVFTGNIRTPYGTEVRVPTSHRILLGGLLTAGAIGGGATAVGLATGRIGFAGFSKPAQVIQNVPIREGFPSVPSQEKESFIQKIQDRLEAPKNVIESFIPSADIPDVEDEADLDFEEEEED